MNPKISYETIDQNRLARLPKYELPPTYQLQKDPGNGCFLDPPGYPSYFTRSVYTQYGNSPPRSAQMLLLGRVVQGPREDYEKVAARLKRLYLPLPIDHPRTRAWIEKLYGYFKNCYQDPAKGPKVADLLIFPVPYYKLKTFTDDPRFSDEWREKERAAVDQANREITAVGYLVAIPENHRAVKYIQEYYPEYKPEINLIHNPTDSPGDWWERYDVQPTPANCPGMWGKKHPASGTWCQMCGFRGEIEA